LEKRYYEYNDDLPFYQLIICDFVDYLHKSGILSVCGMNYGNDVQTVCIVNQKMLHAFCRPAAVRQCQIMKRRYEVQVMSEIQQAYRCSSCSATREYKEGEPVPVCCEKQMSLEALPICATTSHPEMARNTDSDEPCDDGRGAT
jgi:hypothetical protein